MCLEKSEVEEGLYSTKWAAIVCRHELQDPLSDNLEIGLKEMLTHFISFKHVILAFYCLTSPV